MKELKQYLEAGLAALPANPVQKCPAVPSWKEYQSRLPTIEEANAWAATRPAAVCIVCGAVSGNLEAIDFDNHGELFAKWAEALPQELFDRLVIERTPSGGFHASYRCATPVSGNLKLATGVRDGKRVTLIETRGEGGLVLCAPSPGYVLKQGGYPSLATLAETERETLLDAARALDETPKEEQRPAQSAPTAEFIGFEQRPGDDYNRRGDVRALLLAHGWTYLRKSPDGNEHWRRPDKGGDGTSATLKDGAFYVFSSNAAPFEPGKAYSPFAIYSLLEHGGDYTKAASALLAEGYGSRAEHDPVFSTPVADRMEGGNLAQFRESAGASALDPGEMPERLLHVPGFIDEYVDCAMSSAPRPNRVISFCSALAFLSYAAGRKIVSDRNTLPNIYLIALANSGVGKDHPRKVAMTLAVETGIAGGLTEDFKSGSGLEDALYLKPSILFQRDEIDTLFKILKMAKEENSETLMARLLNIYGSSNGSIKLRNLSMPRGELIRMKKEMQENGREDDAAPLVMNPYLTVFGTAVPQFFYEALDRRMLANGMVARCLVLDAGKRGPRQRSAFITIPESLKEAVGTIQSYHGEGGGNLSGVTRPSMRLLTATDGANRMLDELDERHDALYNECAERKSLMPMAFWARATEKAVKLAMLHAISSNVSDPVITEESVAWAGEFTNFATEQALFMAQRYSYENPFDEKCQKIIRHLADARDGCDHSTLLRRSHESRETFQQIMDTLLESGTVAAEVTATGGRSRRVYRLAVKEVTSFTVKKGEESPAAAPGGGDSL